VADAQRFKPSFRQIVRAERDITRYWFPRYQQWLSLNELAYLKQMEGNRG
jgi:hypothetical protein